MSGSLVVVDAATEVLAASLLSLLLLFVVVVTGVEVTDSLEGTSGGGSILTTCLDVKNRLDEDLLGFFSL